METTFLEIPESKAPAPGQLRAVTAPGGQQVLLANLEGALHATGATCPHAGAPLAEGAAHDGRIVCPWHKAEFCLGTGRVLSPPALDDIPAYRVSRANGSLQLQPLPASVRARGSQSDRRCFIIAGAGAAGAVAAQTLREEGYGGRILLLDCLGRVPYDRTIQSKYVLSGEKGGEKSPLQTQAWYAAHDIERLACEVVAVDPHAKRVDVTGGRTFSYDSLLLATGGTPRRPDFPGADHPKAYVLRSSEDAQAILAEAERSTSVAVLGASFIGMEVAASLRERGLSVTVIGREQQPFERQLGAEIGAAFTDLHREKGVSFRLGAGIQQITAAKNGVEIHLGTGETVSADFAVLGFGVSPATSFAQGSLQTHEDGGLIVDAYLRAAPDVFAAGDIAHFPLNGAPVRIEHWRVAQQQGRIAALNMLGRNCRYHAVPVFWTIHYLKRLDYIGHAETWDRIAIHGDVNQRDFLAYYVKDGVVAAAAGFGRDQETAALVALMDGQRDWIAEELGEAPSRLLQL